MSLACCVFLLPIVSYAQALDPFAAASTAPFDQAADSGPLRLWLLADRPYYEPLLAEPHAARIRIIFPGWSSEFPHSINKGDRFAWQVSMGRELPILGWQTEPTNQTVSTNNWGIGIWIPISFHVIEDFKDTSNPIVDTDYRFGFMTKFQYGLVERTTLGIRFVPWAHESTHLGDEYTILAQQDPSFQRVNVSYEYFEYGVSLERRFGLQGRIIARHGGIRPWGDDGYYSDHLLGDSIRRFAPSIKNYEPSFGLEFRRPTAGGNQWFVSADTRYKLAYLYSIHREADEHRHWSWSLAVGRASAPSTNRFLRAFFLYFYKGVNPYGQLRSQNNHTSFGVGWIFQ
jgi:hypothetical protein